jgi:ATPase subunit of ABC transporter with duplicated ATPase domains
LPFANEAADARVMVRASAVDVGVIQWMEEWLKGSSSMAVVFITHDRAFMEVRLCQPHVKYSQTEK